jgi:hypothetical protein
MAVLSNIRQRSLMIAVIAFALFAFIIGDLFSSGGFSTTHQDVGSINGKDISFEDELKSVMLKKVLKELLQLLRRIECGTRGFCSFVNV